MPILMEPVKSSNIKAIGYQPVSKTLVVQFLDGNAYEYANVPKEDYDAWLKADSKGQFFHQNIKSKYPATKLVMPSFNK